MANEGPYGFDCKAICLPRHGRGSEASTNIDMYKIVSWAVHITGVICVAKITYTANIKIAIVSDAGTIIQNSPIIHAVGLISMSYTLIVHI